MSPLPSPPAHVPPPSIDVSTVHYPGFDPQAALPIDVLIAAPAGQPTQAVRTSPASGEQRSYVVRPGDTLSGIAARFGVELGELVRYNGLHADATIRPGQRLRLPATSSAARNQVKANRNQATTGTWTRVTVRPGDTVEAIAARNGVSVSSVLRANGLSASSTIRPGQGLAIPSGVRPSGGPVRHPNLSQAAAANQRHLNESAAPSRTQVRQMIVDAARRHGVDPRLALAIAWQESGWNQRAVSSANAIGVMQCLPSTAEWVSGIAGQKLNILHAQDSVTCGVVLLRTLQRSLTSERDVVAAYYQGLQSIRDNGWYSETSSYVTKVMALKARM